MSESTDDNSTATPNNNGNTTTKSTTDEQVGSASKPDMPPPAAPATEPPSLPSLPPLGSALPLGAISPDAGLTPAGLGNIVRTAATTAGDYQALQPPSEPTSSSTSSESATQATQGAVQGDGAIVEGDASSSAHSAASGTSTTAATVTMTPVTPGAATTPAPPPSTNSAKVKTETFTLAPDTELRLELAETAAKVEEGDSSTENGATASSETSGAAPMAGVTGMTGGDSSKKEKEGEDDGFAEMILLDGTAEVFGVELAPNLPVQVPYGTRTSVFSWHGARVRVHGPISLAYVSSETSVNRMHLSIHHLLEARRGFALTAGETAAAVAALDADKPDAPPPSVPAAAFGPRMLVVGPTDAGKSTLCRILTNYAVRTGWTPTLVDLDVGQGALGVPGSVGAMPIQRVSSVVGPLQNNSPYIVFTGHAGPSEHPGVYRLCVNQLAATLRARLTAAEPRTRASGVVINTMGWIDGLGLNFLFEAAKTFAVDLVVVVGDERLYHTVNQSLGAPNGPCVVVHIPRSGGVVTRSQASRRTSRMSRIRSYFYGTPGFGPELASGLVSVTFDEVIFWRLMAAPDGTSAQPVPIRPGMELLNAIASVSHAKVPTDLATSNTAGFVYVKTVDPAARRIILLSPVPSRRFPFRHLIVGTLKWLD